jgi:hypothetical protein
VNADAFVQVSDWRTIRPPKTSEVERVQVRACSDKLRCPAFNRSTACCVRMTENANPLPSKQRKRVAMDLQFRSEHRDNGTIALARFAPDRAERGK